ncbi:hypothetical protein TMatcc_003116 [Talaromyces marneffei ATCC 18224]
MERKLPKSLTILLSLLLNIVVWEACIVELDKTTKHMPNLDKLIVEFGGCWSWNAKSPRSA